MIGFSTKSSGPDGYRRSGDDVRQIIKGRKHSLIRQRFKMAGHLRLALDNLDWDG